MKPLSLYVAAAEVVDLAYLGMPDPDAAPWPRHLVMLLLGFIPGAGVQSGRYVDLAIRAILTLPVDVRDMLLAEYHLPHVVLSGLENPPPWPEAIAVDGWAAALGIDLEQTRMLALKRIHHRTGKVRELYVTAITGQPGTYLLKQKEAEAWTALATKPADPAEQMAGFPHLAREATRKGVTLDDTAASILGRAATYAGASAALEDARQGAQDAIAAALTEEDIAAAEAAFHATADAVAAAAP